LSISSQDSQYVAQKILSLAVIKIREAEAKRMIHQSETDQQKSNRLKNIVIIMLKKNLIKHN